MKEWWKEQFPEVKVCFHEPLKKYTYTKTGGEAECLIFPKDKHETAKIIKALQEKQIQITVLGNASNVIVRDGGIKGAVILLNEMTAMKVMGNKILAEAGVSLIEVTKCALEQSLTGLEFACGIPGSVGGAMYMNAGAYGGEVCEVVEYVDAVTRTGEIKRLTNEELEFSYRHSALQESGDLVIDVCFNLNPGEKETIQAKMEELTHLRESKQPLEYPSCGSVFKRPEGHFTGKLIQDAGLQGFQIGGAQVSKKHAGFIVNIDHATATDYLAVIQHVQEVVFEQFQGRLEPEVKIIGEESK